jgi:2-polyprenyl-3-methyl-5-hydroxy-6-metoxy-1,4-benzoquinol methylase
MTSNIDRKKNWNERYRIKSGQALLPESFLIDHLSCLKAGSVLDIACGDGRNSIFLAEKGFKVTGMDFSEIALDRLRKAADEKNLPIETIEMDLDEGFSAIKKFDNLIVIHFKLSNLVLDQIPNLLTPDGLFLYYTFNRKHAETSSFPEAFCLEEAALVDKSWNLEMLEYTTTVDNQGFRDGYLFRK